MRMVRSFAALLAVVALVATLPVTCPCPPRPVAHHAAAHDCCAPPTGVRAVAHGCCDAGAPAVDAAVAAPAPLAAAPVVVAVLPPTAASPAQAALYRAAAVSASPPPLVLRI